MMMKHSLFINFIVVTLLATLLAFECGRVSPVYALAQPDPFINAEFAPVYDTQIYQLEDYMQTLTPAQGDVFWIMMGLYVAAQGGMSEYQLADPFANQSGVINWLKSCGIQLYNSLIGMGAIGPDPITGIDYRPFLKGASQIAMGAAVKASTYTDENDFLNDVNVQEKYLVPFMPDIQSALNYTFAKGNGLYNWQFENSDFTSNYNFPTAVIPVNSNYWDLLLSLHQPLVRLNMQAMGWGTNAVMNSTFTDTYRNLWFNTQNNTAYFCDDNGNYIDANATGISCRLVYYSNNLGRADNYSFTFYPRKSYTLQNNSWQDTVQYYIDNAFYFSTVAIGVNDFVLHYYYGATWDTKHEILNTSDLNFDENTIPYYQQITNDYLLDLKGIINDLVGDIDLTNIILNNLLDLDGVIVHDPDLIRVTTEILEEIQDIYVPLPVDLNDLAEVTTNNYVDEVKRASEGVASVIGEYVAFWHNADYVTVYVVLGCSLLVLVAALVGKMGK